jgi:hypothetical protein
MSNKPVWKLTDKELRRIERNCQDEERALAAGEELRARRQFREEHDDTPCIEWNGWNHPGEY